MLYDGKQAFADFIVDSVTVSYLVRYDNLLQNATDIITKYESYFITKCERSLFQQSISNLIQQCIKSESKTPVCAK